MASKPLVNVSQASEFYDALADLVLSMSTEDIRSEMKAEGLNPDVEIEKTRSRLLSVVGYSESVDFKATVTVLLHNTARSVSEIVSGSLPRNEKKQMLQVVFAKASSESQFDVQKVVSSLKNLSDEDKRLISESIANVLKKHPGIGGPDGPS